MRLALVLAAVFITACGPAVEPESELSMRSTKQEGYPSKQERYPTAPDDSMTPGDLCSNPSSHRYPEHIPYCNRSVSSRTKKKIIKTYDETFGYTIGSMPRDDFKIDHYIPLCMGGSNSISNLWPQHKSVYDQTDELEQELCLYMERGRMQQADAITYIKYIKNHLDEMQRIKEEIVDTYGAI